jgi:hypothetical protein
MQASSMAITSKCKIALRPGTMFCFGTISSIADEEGTLHRIADPLEKKLSSKIPRGARAEQRVAQPPASRAKMTSYKPKVGSLRTRKTSLSTSPTKEWTRITRKKGSKHPECGNENTPSHLSDAFALKGGQKKERHRAGSFLRTPTSSSSGRRLESSPVAPKILFLRTKKISPKIF